MEAVEPPQRAVETDGHLLQYLKKYPGASRVSTSSVHDVYDSQYAEFNAHRMLGVVDGLSYLHFNDVVHGDLKVADRIN